MEEIKIGFCTNCDTQIFDPSQKGHVRFLPEYNEHVIELSNESLMRVGVCSKCKDTLVRGNQDAEDMASNILERHKLWWGNHLPAEDPRKPKFHHALAVVDTNSNPAKLRKRIKENETEKEKVRMEQAVESERKKIRNFLIG
jgi:hypothetical protein